MSEAGAEAMLKKVRKLEGNRRCCNCDTEVGSGFCVNPQIIVSHLFLCLSISDFFSCRLIACSHHFTVPAQSPTGLGFGNICVKYSTFVCDMCKTSHQAISHRCKSVSMSTWTTAEVLALTAAKVRAKGREGLTLTHTQTPRCNVDPDSIN